MRRRPRQLSPAEEQLWRHATRDTVPLDPASIPDNRPPLPTQAGPAESRTATIEEKRPAERVPSTTHRPDPGRPATLAPTRHSHELDRLRPVDMDRRNWQRLKRGQMSIDARLDLHGSSQEEAHRRLDSFLMAQQARGARCVLVITGMGQRNGGILRHMTPRWLDAEPNKSRIIAYSPAHIRDGGHGALYVLLKRKR